MRNNAGFWHYILFLIIVILPLILKTTPDVFILNSMLFQTFFPCEPFLDFKVQFIVVFLFDQLHL